MSTAREVGDRIADDLRTLRRDLHRQPEIGLQNPWTQKRILDELAGLDVEITLGRDLTSVVGVIRGQTSSETPYRPVVLLRGDMDALPVHEETGEEWTSQVPGVMHACGHDLHVAGLVGAARILHELRGDLAGDVVLMFQPGEEGPGGAEVMVREGLLDVAGRRVDAAYAIHVIAAEEPHGVWYGRPGPTMAGADEVTLVVNGRGGHGSAPHRALDPVPVACEIVLALEVMVTRKVSAFEPVVITVGRINAGTRCNIIADTAEIQATVRTFSEESRALVLHEVERVAKGIAAAHGMDVEILHDHGYPVTINDETEFGFAKSTLVKLFGEQRWADMPFPEAGSEDMSFVQREVPGAYVYVSATPPGVDPKSVDDNHSPRAVFDDAVVPDMAIALAELALRRCRR